MTYYLCIGYNVQINVHEHFGVIMDAARANLASTMAQVCDDHAPIIITRKLLESIAELEQDEGKQRESLE